MLYLVQFLEKLSICPKRGRNDLNNLLWHGVENCKKVEFHTSYSKETYGNRVSSEKFKYFLCIHRHLWHLNFIYISITFDLRLKYKQMMVFFPNTMQWLRKLSIYLPWLNFSHVLKHLLSNLVGEVCIWLNVCALCEM